MNHLRTLAISIAVALCQIAFWPAAAVHATPLYGVSLESGSVSSGTLSTPVSMASEFFSPIDTVGNFYFKTAFAAADRGWLGASAHGNIFFPDMRAVGSGTILAGTDASAGFILDDLIITGPAGSDFVMSALNLHLDGGVGANAFARNLDGAGTSEAFANATVTVNGTLNGTSFSGTQSRGSVYDVGTGGDSSFFEDSILTGWSGGDISSPDVLLPVGSAFTLYLSLAASELTSVTSVGFGDLPVERKAEADASFASTLSFPLFGSVFDLPDGYTVNSLGGLIVNNRWVGAPQGAGVTVSEPPTLAVLGASLFFFWVFRFRSCSKDRVAAWCRGSRRAPFAPFGHPRFRTDRLFPLKGERQIA
jgi:hypothetical protein